MEALGNNLNVVSTRTGAVGVDINITNQKMNIVKDDDWRGFVKKIISSNNAANIGKDFFDHFNWTNISKRAKDILLDNSHSIDDKK